MKSMFMTAAVLVAAAFGASASGLGDPFAAVRGLPVGEEEAALIEGGDVKMTLNAERTSLSVSVTPAKDKATGHKLAGTARNYEVEAHNRVQDTKDASYMPPGGKKPAALADKGEVTSKPEKFPAGTWKVTSVAKREDKFGPNIMKTNAVGKVEVYDKDKSSLGKHEDVGYAIHSNTNTFSSSVSHGCIIVKQSDNKKLAATLKRDKQSWGGDRQTITVSE